MLQVLVQTAHRLFHDLSSTLKRGQGGSASADRPATEQGQRYLPLERILLTDGVSRTLFEEYAAHRDSARGNEETGWQLLGFRESTQAVPPWAGSRSPTCSVWASCACRGTRFKRERAAIGRCRWS